MTDPWIVALLFIMLILINTQIMLLGLRLSNVARELNRLAAALEDTDG